MKGSGDFSIGSQVWPGTSNCPPCNRMRNNLVTVTEFEVMMNALLAFRHSQERTGS
jgi:hypothetical protein